ncbi:threonyl-tRNA synthetase [Plectosphaerella plurivora]|uniref:threonine--tRNA ligase n=1 Tax=Plectosphaerella plurivora TaxID=936078 RepID=A0A9P8VK51_9PEZI|nr:threonyl-tRNA synthetase [Plectosphaerella plurivora]
MILPLRANRSALRHSLFLARPLPRSPTPLYRLYSSSKPKPDSPNATSEPPDHRKLGTQQELFMTSIYSPGSPIFLPNGARIFNRLVDFLRRQYIHYGFEEVITPNIYKKSLWEVSGHLENYAEDMYTVVGGTRQTEAATPAPDHTHDGGCCGGDRDAVPSTADDEYGLKPMNCPGHCLIFASKARSYRDLPIRYADFSPLHRNEISGALSGLTRVRRFHQDDGHIFCRPSQIQAEVFRTLDFMKAVYGALGIRGYSFALSTRPFDHYMGTDAEWARAEEQLRAALDQAGQPYTVKEGDGAFYGPKIDVMLSDSDGRTHQAGTIQLDFQLPQRFNLKYQAPAPEQEALGVPLEEVDASLKDTYGPVTPVLVHRAILGSVERLMALLIEEYNGKWPFWLNPRQVAILAINDADPVVAWAERVKGHLTGHDASISEDERARTQPAPTGITVDIDLSARPLGQKLEEAKAKNYGVVLVVGNKNVASSTVTLNDGSRQNLSLDELMAKLKDMVNTYQ